MQGGKAGTAGQREAVGAGPPARNEPESDAILRKMRLPGKTVYPATSFLAAAAAGFGPLGGSRDHEDGQPLFARLRWTEREFLQNHWKSMEMRERHPLGSGTKAWVTNAATLEHVRTAKRWCGLVHECESGKARILD